MRWVGVILLAFAAASATPRSDSIADYPRVVPGIEFRFPRDHGAHPAFRIEWWYLTGWLERTDRKPIGFQITFFRLRPATDPANPSRFAPKQLIIAHAAISDPATRVLVHDQRMARAGFGIAAAREGDANVALLDWSLRRSSTGVFRVLTPARGFALDLAFNPTQPPMLNGNRGHSRKGPQPEQASYYYSMPQLAVSGRVTLGGKRIAVTGRAWLDREWSSTPLDPRAVGWDWAGINFDDGAALMAFQVRGRDGRAMYAGGTWRRADGSQLELGPEDVRFVPRRRWRSPQSGAIYPVAADFLVRLPEGIKRFPLKPMFDAQELGGRGSLMLVYWEGAVTTTGGRGYLEMTGYAAPLRL